MAGNIIWIDELDGLDIGDLELMLSYFSPKCTLLVGEEDGKQYIEITNVHSDDTEESNDD